MSETEPVLTDDETIAGELGCELSQVVQFAAQILQRTGAYSVLCPACGQGEGSAYFARRGFRVTAYDVSVNCVTRVERTAERIGVYVDCFVDDVVLPARRLQQFDAIFSHSALHQMRSQQRRSLLRSFHRSLRQGGVLIVSVLSATDERYGYGRQVEADTFEFAMGETIHFYHADELHAELSEFFDVAHVEEMQEVQMQCGLGRQSYKLLVATALKTDRDR